MKKVFTAIDIGTTKVTCLIADYNTTQQKFTVLGAGQYASRGVKKGFVTHLEKTETSILNAVHMAEKKAGLTIDHVVINVSGKHLMSELVALSSKLPQQVVTEDDINNLVLRASRVDAKSPFDVMHAFPLQHTLDTTKGIKDPRGMMGRTLTTKIHVITADKQALKNVLHAVHRCHLNTSSVIVSGVASGYAALTEDEMERGVTLIDMGGDTIEIANFYEGNVIHTLSIPLGGLHITSDIAHGLQIPLQEAERLKILHGSALETGDDDKVLLNIKDAQHRPLKKRVLTQIIKPRVEEIFKIVKARLEASNMYKISGRRIVLTGGGSLLPSIKIVAGQVLGRQVRLGMPLRLMGPGEDLKNPSLTTAAGLLEFAYQDWWRERHANRHKKGWGALFDWVKENF